MRKEKPLPKESSFQEYSDNRAKNPKKTRARTSKPRFKTKDDGKSTGSSGGRKTSSRDNDRRKSSSDSRGRTSSRDSDRRSSSRDSRSGSSSYSRGSAPRQRSRSGDNYRGPNRMSSSRDNRDSKRRDDKHDRRSSRGKSFKEDRRESNNSWDSVPKNKRGDERRARGKVEMFDAKCKKCGKACKVPFKPQMSKGVSCSDCFSENSRDNYKKSSGYGERKPGNFARTNGGVKELFDAVCMKCKKPCKVPFKPTGKMGVSCSNCYVKKESPGRGRSSGRSSGRESFGRGRPSLRLRR